VFNISATELLVIAIVALLILGPDKLPDAMRKLGRATRELRRITSGFEAELRDALSDPPEPPKAKPAAQAPMNPTATVASAAPVESADSPAESLSAETTDSAASTSAASEGTSASGETGA
jgi:sec-independent protein translocase protein TatB